MVIAVGFLPEIAWTWVGISGNWNHGFQLVFLFDVPGADDFGLGGTACRNSGV
jgi:hypothetical protein